MEIDKASIDNRPGEIGKYITPGSQQLKAIIATTIQEKVMGEFEARVNLLQGNHPQIELSISRCRWTHRQRTEYLPSGLVGQKGLQSWITIVPIK